MTKKYLTPFIFHREFVKSESDSLSKQRKNFINFKESYLKQHAEKMGDLARKFVCKGENSEEEKKELEELEDDFSVNEEDIVEIEFSNKKSASVKRGVLTKFPNSKLAACFNGHISLPKRNNKFFIDREERSFRLLLEYLKSGKMPSFQSEGDEDEFFDEVNFWTIPISTTKGSTVKFDIGMVPTHFHIDKTQRNLCSTEASNGIAFIKKSLNASSPYFEFTLSITKDHALNKKLIVALIESTKLKKNFLFSSFENGVPFVFYWDIFNQKIVKCNKEGKNIKEMNLNKLHYFNHNKKEMKIGLLYKQDKRTLELYRDNSNLGVVIENIQPNLTPAIEVKMEEYIIQLSNVNEPQEKVFL